MDEASQQAERINRAVLQTEALADVKAERVRQEQRVGTRFDWTATNTFIDPAKKFLILTEEVGEVAREIHENSLGDTSEDEFQERLYKELTQVAAIAVAWMESLKAGGN